MVPSTFEENLDKRDFAAPSDYVVATAGHKAHDVLQTLKVHYHAHFWIFHSLSSLDVFADCSALGWPCLSMCDYESMMWWGDMMMLTIRAKMVWHRIF